MSCLFQRDAAIQTGERLQQCTLPQRVLIGPVNFGNDVAQWICLIVRKVPHWDVVYKRQKQGVEPFGFGGLHPENS